jgi:hypothetical protein
MTKAQADSLSKAVLGAIVTGTEKNKSWKELVSAEYRGDRGPAACPGIEIDMLQTLDGQARPESHYCVGSLLVSCQSLINHLSKSLDASLYPFNDAPEINGIITFLKTEVVIFNYLEPRHV